MQQALEDSCVYNQYKYTCKYTICSTGGCITDNEFNNCQQDCNGNCIKPIMHFNFKKYDTTTDKTEIFQSEKYICPDALTYYGVFALIPSVVVILIIIIIIICCVSNKNRKKADQELTQQVNKLKSEVSVANLLGNPEVCNQLQQVFNQGLSRNASMADFNNQNNILEEGTVLHKASSQKLIPQGTSNRSRVYDGSVHESFKDNC